MPLERKRYLLTTHLAQIEAMVGLPVGVVDTQGYGWRDASTELVRGYWLEPHDEHWQLWTCLPQPRFRWLFSWDALESWHAQRHRLEPWTQMLSTEEAAALVALTTP